MRDNRWLQELLDTTWDSYFSDIAQDNDVRIVFGRRAKRRLGSISLDPANREVSVITMNGIFKSEEIPEFVIQATLVHELTHYAQGFNSPLAQAQAHPHAGGVMKREFTERGLLELYLNQKRWLKINWPQVLAKEFPPTILRRKPDKSSGLPKGIWFLGK